MQESSPANAKLLGDFLRRSVAHTIQSGGASKRMNSEVYRREPTGKEYHTGPRAAGRGSAARQCVVKEKTRGIADRLRGGILKQLEESRQPGAITQSVKPTSPVVAGQLPINPLGRH